MLSWIFIVHSDIILITSQPIFFLNAVCLAEKQHLPNIKSLFYQQGIKHTWGKQADHNTTVVGADCLVTFSCICTITIWSELAVIKLSSTSLQGRIQDFKLGGGGVHLYFFRVFLVKNHDFTPIKNLIFSNFMGGACLPLDQLLVCNCTPKNSQ
jgi:hypothetical protein